MHPLSVRQDQMTAMAARSREDFERRLVGHLRKAFPEQSQQASDAELLERARPAVDTAQKHGIKAEYDTVRFVDLTFLFGVGFHTSPDAPWAHGVLEVKALAGWQKADILWSRGKEQLARAAALAPR